MSKKTSLLLSPGLALLLSLGAGCKAAPEKSVVAGVPAGKTVPGQQATAPQAGGTTTAPSAAAPGAAGRQLAPLHLPGAPGAAPQPGAPGGAALSPEKIPAVVARVNGQEIKKSDLLDGAQVVQMQLAQMGQQASPTADFYRKTLDSLIAYQLLEQDAKAQGVTVPETDVQQAVAGRKSQLKFPSEAEYKKALAQAGITENDLLARARQQLTIRKYVTTKLAPKATVSDQAVRDFYDKHKEQEMKVPERRHVRHILLTVNPKAPAAERDKARQKAQDILKRLQAGEDFGKLAEELSDDPRSKTRKGDLGWLIREQTRTVPAFGDAVFALKQPNDLSPVIEAPYGFQIVQLIERKEAGTMPFDDVKDRIAQMLKEEEVQKMIQARAQELRAKSKVEVYL
jgi:peptidyl-prolyl cis-trans isomerase C